MGPTGYPPEFADGTCFEFKTARRKTVKRALMILGLIALSGIGIAEATDPTAGKVKAAACAGCHGANGRGSRKSTARRNE